MRDNNFNIEEVYDLKYFMHRLLSLWGEDLGREEIGTR